MRNIYNEENEKYAEIRQILRSLPLINAPENFDSELKRRINLLPSVHERKPVFNFYFRRALIPAAAFVLTSIILFFVINSNPEEEYYNPFKVTPPLITDRIPVTDVNSPFSVSKNDVILKNEINRVNVASAPSTNYNITESNTAYGNRIREFLAEHQGANVDRSLRALPGNSDNPNSRSSTVNFGGFNIYQEDDKTMDELRARMDSIKKWMRESDSR